VSGVIHDDGEAAMSTYTEKTIVLRDDTLAEGQIKQGIGDREQGTGLGAPGLDYSEEAIPERDPSYCLPASTDYQEATVEALSPETRLDLARCFEQLGMSRARAAFVVSL
jgi:hypothetical protein